MTYLVKPIGWIQKTEATFLDIMALVAIDSNFSNEEFEAVFKSGLDAATKQQNISEQFSKNGNPYGSQLGGFLADFLGIEDFRKSITGVDMQGNQLGLADRLITFGIAVGSVTPFGKGASIATRVGSHFGRWLPNMAQKIQAALGAKILKRLQEVLLELHCEIAWA